MYYLCPKFITLKFNFQIKLYRKLRYRKGHRVHSPFAYDLITRVIEEKTPYYVYEEIEIFRKASLSFENPLHLLTAEETQSPNYGALLFRLVNFFKCRTVLQIGGSTGLIGLYLALPLRKSCDCFVLEERKGLLENIQTFVNIHSLNNMYTMEGDYSVSLKDIRSKTETLDFIFINTMGNAKKTHEAIGLVETFIFPDTVMVIDNISTDREMKKLWKELKSRQDVRMTIDLLSLGLVFFNPRFHRQHYKNYFNDGKKQNLYQKRRRGFNILSWRKKGIESRHTC